MLCTRATLLVVLLATSASAQGALWVVDDDGGAGVDFTDLPAAVAAASSGDLVLVRDGLYSGFTLVSKSVGIVAERGARAEVSGTIEISSQNFVEWAFLRGLHSPARASQRGLAPFQVRFLNSQGETWVEDCTLVGSAAMPAAARVENASKAAFVRSQLRGADGAPGAPGGAGLFAQASIVRVYDSTLVGGAGGAAQSGHAGAGGPGCFFDRFTLFTSGSSFDGGAGGAGGGTPCVPGAAGGAGIRLAGLLPHLQQLDSVLSGGAGGEGARGEGACGDGPPGADLEPSPSGSSVTPFPFPARSLQATHALAAGSPGAWTIAGEPGDLAVLVVGLFIDHTFLEPFAGALFPGERWFFVVAGSVPAGGSLTAGFVAPAIPSVVEAFVLFQQVLHLDASGSLVLGAPSSTLVVPPGL